MSVFFFIVEFDCDYITLIGLVYFCFGIKVEDCCMLVWLFFEYSWNIIFVVLHIVYVFTLSCPLRGTKVFVRC